MPLYDYRCDRCDTQFEIRQSFSDDTLRVCPVESGPAACTSPGDGPVKKVFTGVGISFKGDGFYKNDHGANAHGRRKERESVSSNGSSDSGSGSGSSSSSKSSPDSGSSSSSKSSPDSGSSSSSKSSPDSASSKTEAKAGAST